MIDGLYWDKWYNGEEAKTQTSILYENYLITAPHLRQLRVRNDSCLIHKDFQKTIFSCYNSYADYLEERDQLRSSVGFKWTPINSFARNSIWGMISTYSGDGGYIVDLGLNKSIAREIIQSLKQNLWIDRGTRVIFIDFTTYNPNINLFMVSKLIAEFPATGGMITSWQFRTMSLLHSETQSIFKLIISIAFIFFIIYYAIEEAIELKTLGLGAYFGNFFWNFLDLLTIMFAFLLVFFSFYQQYVINKIFQKIRTEDKTNNSATLIENMETYQFDTLGFWSTQFNNMLALLTFIVWIKIFKYISFNKTMSQLSNTLSRVS